MEKSKYEWWYVMISDVPASSGVYEVWSGEVALYIGQSSNMLKRLRYHPSRKNFQRLRVTHVRWTSVKNRVGHRVLLESMLTIRYRPILVRESYGYEFTSLHRRFFWSSFRNYKHPARWVDGRFGMIGTPRMVEQDLPLKKWRMLDDAGSGQFR